MVNESVSVLRWVWEHPANQAARKRAVWRAIRFQARGRLLRQPTMAKVGKRGLLLVDPHSRGTSLAVYASPHDWAEMHAWERLLSPGDLFIDIGAHNGLYSIFAGSLGAEVIAVEPNPATFPTLFRNIALNDFQISIKPVAVAAEPGDVRFFADGPTSRIGCGPITVQATTLDVILGDRFAAGVKIDVEGAERLVIEGAARALADKRIACLQIEWNRLSQKNFGETREPLAELLLDHGYRLYRPDGDGHLVEVGQRPALGADVFALAHCNQPVD